MTGTVTHIYSDAEHDLSIRMEVPWPGGSGRIPGPHIDIWVVEERRYWRFVYDRTEE